MTQSKAILVADDDTFMHEIYQQALSDSYTLVMTESGEDALMAATTERPALILLDVEMPGIDGYETCRRLRRIGVTSSIPVIFVSGHDGIEDRVRGYDAGGDDYVVKPFDAQELRAKTQRLLKAAAERNRFHAMASEANQSAIVAMADMSDAGALLQSLQRFNGCADALALADALVGGLSLLELKGVAQVRGDGVAVTRSSSGEAGPLERSVIDRINEMDQVMHFKSGLSIRQHHVSLLVNNMPANDEGRCERLREGLAVLAEAAEERARGLIIAAAARRRGDAIANIEDTIGRLLAKIDARPSARLATGEAVATFVDAMQQAYVSVALSAAQEEFMDELVSRGIENMLHTQRDDFDIRSRLDVILRELQAAHRQESP